jgi:hypothetical protein
MADKEASEALHDPRAAPQVNGAAPGGLPPATTTICHQWTLQFLIAAIKKPDETKLPQRDQ